MGSVYNGQLSLKHSKDDLGAWLEVVENSIKFIKLGKYIKELSQEV